MGRDDRSRYTGSSPSGCGGWIFAALILCGALVWHFWPSAPGSGNAKSGSANVEWYYYDSRSQRCGPVSRDSLASLLGVGQLPLDSRVWRSGMDTWAPAQDVGEFSQAVASRRQAEAQAKQADRRRQEEDRRREQERNAENERSREQNRNEQTTRDSQRREQAQEQDRRQQAARRYIATYYPRYGGIYSTARAAADEAARLNRIQEAQVDAASEAVMNSTRRGEATVVTSGIRAGRWRYTYDRNLDGFVVYHE